VCVAKVWFAILNLRSHHKPLAMHQRKKCPPYLKGIKCYEEDIGRSKTGGVTDSSSINQKGHKVMRLFFVLVCCLAIPLVAQATDQGNNKKQQQTTQSQPQSHQQRQQITTQSKHYGTSTVSRPKVNNSSQLTGRGQNHALNAQNNHVRVNTKGKVGTTLHSSNTASQQKLNNSSQLTGRGQNHALNAQNNHVRVAQSSTQGKLASKHFALSNSPNPKIASAKFNRNYRIQGSQNWQGQKYGAFQNYRGQWHNQNWWHSHYNRIVLINGGWYFWNANYWYPAWGYNSAFAYYPYNGPIYAYNNLPPDQVIANVQSTLQAQGYYRGTIDGVLGPVTQAALASYQRDHNLYATAAIDEPTLESLGMS